MIPMGDYIEYAIWRLQVKVKDLSGTMWDYVISEASIAKRDRIIEAAFVFQIQLVLGTSVYFAEEASRGIQHLLQLLDDSLFSKRILGGISVSRLAVMASAGALLSSLLFGCLLLMMTIMMKMPRARSPYHILQHMAFNLPWAVPLILGMVKVLLASSLRTTDPQLGALSSWVQTIAPLFLVAGATYMAIKAICTYFHKQLQVSATVLKAALQSLLVSLHPTQMRQAILFKILSHLWILSWCVAVVGVYQWTKEQRVLVPRTVVLPGGGGGGGNYYYSSSSTSSFFGSMGGSSSSSGQNQQTQRSFTILMEREMSLHPAIIVFFGISLLWTQQACHDLVRVLIATTLGQWWRSGRSSSNNNNKGSMVGLSALVVAPLPYSVGTCLLKTLHSHLMKMMAGSFTCAFRIVQHHIVRWMLESVNSYDSISHSTVGTETSATKETCENISSILLSTSQAGTSRLSILEWGFFCDKNGSTLANVLRPPEDYEVIRKLHQSIGLSLILYLCKFAIAMTSASLAWFLDSFLFCGSNNHSTMLHQSFILGFVAGWISGGSLLSIFQTAQYATLLGVVNFEPDGNLFRTNMYFTLRKELQKAFPKTIGVKLRH